MDIQIKVEMDARASSHYTRETIERRLAALLGCTDEAAQQEVAFLTALLEQQ